MIFEIHGGQFSNKGAMKMLVTCIKQLQLHFPDATFVVDGCVGQDNQLASAGLKKLLFRRGWMGSKRFGPGFLIQRILARLADYFPSLFKSSYTLNKIDGLIDVAGFAYTDQWGYKPSEDFAKLASYYHSKGTPVIMLPQAFGTFTHPRIVPAIDKIIRNANLILARDKSSFNHLLTINDNKNVVQRAPDITLFENISDNASQELGNQVAVIPNMRILDQGNEFWQANYVQYLNKVIDACIEKQLEPLFFIHDQSGEDIKVAEIALSKRNDQIQILQVDDPWELKSMLSNVRFVIGSRFHGLVAALSNNVPVISIGWSHKYAELLSDFGLSDFLVTEQHSEEQVTELIDILSHENTNQLKREIIAESFEKQKSINKQMWSKVTGILQSNQK